MSRIVLLDKEVINQIAAGEVVERPASVVKELVENSIDAGSSKIFIEIKEAGLREIKVVDNGIGMTEEEALLAIKRHATSKIKKIEDLKFINTLGFRGEALPAIASVSKLTLITRPSELAAGTKLVIEGGDLKNVTTVGCPGGTQITVKDLFYNTPARRKFLKSTVTETNVVSDLIIRYALGYPGIAFHFYVNNKCCLATNGCGNPLDVASLVYGKEVARHLIRILYQEEEVGMDGIISIPPFTRASRNYQFFFINKRLVRNKLLFQAIEGAYMSYIPKFRFPLAVIYLTLDPATVDVNVHPTKSDVRFQNTDLIKRVIYNGIRNALARNKLNSVCSISGSALRSVGIINKTSSNSNNFFSKDKNDNRVKNVQPKLFESELLYSPTNSNMQELISETKIFFQNLSIIGQAQKTYIIAEKEDGIYIIDQHAAHERIRYEQIKKQIQKKDMFAQKLFEELEIELNIEEKEIYEQNQNIFFSLGFSLKQIYDNFFKLSSVPMNLRDEPRHFFKDILVLFQETYIKREDLSIFYDKAAMLYACKSAVKAGDLLTQEEMRNILIQLDFTEQPESCPHGRPTYFRLLNSEILKKFYR